MSRAGDVLGMQLAIVLYSVVSVLAKINSGYPTLSVEFIGIFLLQIVLLAIYAYFWQQLLKRFHSSTAYCYRAAAVIWTLIWSVVIFGETISRNNLIGAILIVFGIILGGRD